MDGVTQNPIGNSYDFYVANFDSCSFVKILNSNFQSNQATYGTQYGLIGLTNITGGTVTVSNSVFDAINSVIYAIYAPRAPVPNGNLYVSSSTFIRSHGIYVNYAPIVSISTSNFSVGYMSDIQLDTITTTTISNCLFQTNVLGTTSINIMINLGTTVSISQSTFKNSLSTLYITETLGGISFRNNIVTDNVAYLATLSNIQCTSSTPTGNLTFLNNFFARNQYGKSLISWTVTGTPAYSSSVARFTNNSMWDNTPISSGSYRPLFTDRAVFITHYGNSVVNLNVFNNPAANFEMLSGPVVPILAVMTIYASQNYWNTTNSMDALLSIRSGSTTPDLQPVDVFPICSDSSCGSMTGLSNSAYFNSLVSSQTYGSSPANMYVIGGTLTSSTSLLLANSPYIANRIVIPNGVTLTIPAGVVINMMPYASIEVNGALTTTATAGQPIVIQPATAFYGASQSGDWGQIWVRESSSTSTFTDASYCSNFTTCFSCAYKTTPYGMTVFRKRRTKMNC